ncbi:MAG TPA: sigma 54-interacting transcriptional regulator, partial [Polyangiaceae bacterium]
MSQQVTTISRSVRVVEYQKTRLSVISGPDAGLSLEIAGGAVRIGTAEENDLILTDDTVSRRHCEVIPTPNGIRIRDDGSTNLVVVGGVLVVDATFTGPIQIELGNTVITITPLTETVYREQLDTDRFGDLLGKSAPMQELFADLERIAPTELSLLIEGETGTGKELIARAIHELSPRAAGPYIRVNCGALSESLLESELFGHVRGAFTGAIDNRTGRFEAAHTGTIFL